MKRTIFIIMSLFIIGLTGCSIKGPNRKIADPPEQNKQIKKGEEVLEQFAEDENVPKPEEISSKDFFDKVTDTVKKDWEADARIFQIHTIVSNSEIENIARPDGGCIWQVDYISPSRQRMINIFLSAINSSSFDSSKILYNYKNTRSDHEGRAHIDLIKGSIENKLAEIDIAKSSTPYTLSNEWFTGWEIDFKNVAEIVSKRLKESVVIQNTPIEINLYHVNKWQGLLVNSPIWEINWKTSGNRYHYLIINAKTGEILADITRYKAEP